MMDSEEEMITRAETPVAATTAGDSMDDIVLDIDGEQLIFSDDTFPSLPDFPCLSSPCSNPSLSSSSAASGDASSAAAAMPPPSSEGGGGLDIDIDLLDLSDPLDPSFLFSDESLMIIDDTASVPNNPTEDDGDWLFGGEAFGPSEELAVIFLDWLKSNKDSISPEDLKNIKLKRSTIECAVRRLGGGKEGRVQLLKLILSWVQNHHLQKKRRRNRNHHHQQQNTTTLVSPSPFAYQYHQLPQPFSPPNFFSSPRMNPNPNPNLDQYSINQELSSNFPQCNNPWIPYPEVPASFQSIMMSYAGVGEAGMYPSAAGAVPFMNRQTFSPYAVATASPVAEAYAPFPGPSSPQAQYAAGGFMGQFPAGQQLFHRGQQRFAAAAVAAAPASATKEARKKRMARQRRFSSHNHHHPPNSRPIETIAMPSSSEGTSTRNWAFGSIKDDTPPPPNSSTIQTPPPPPNSSTIQTPPPQPSEPPQQHASSSSGRRQGLKGGEKNLRFLLQKVLKQSDVGSLGRIVLPKKEAEIHLPELDSRDGISLAMEDIGTSRVWNMRYRFWPNNKSRMYLLENTGDFIRSNGLQEGDFIVIYSDIKCSKYMIRGVKVRQQSLELKRTAAARRGGFSKQAHKRSCPEKAAGSYKPTTATGNCDNLEDDYNWESPMLLLPLSAAGDSGEDTNMDASL